MEIIAFLVLVVSAVTGLTLAALPRSKGRRVMVVSLWLGIPLLIFLGDEAIGQIYLKVRCSVEGGHKITKTVEAEGYFDATRDSGCALGCLEALSRRGFDYYEAEARDQYQYHAPEKGIYRFQIIDQARGGCAGGRAIPREPEFVQKGKCVAATRLNRIEAKFEVSMIKNTEVGPGFFKAQQVYSYVKDRDSGQLLGSATSFRYWGGWLRNNSFGHNSASSCPTFADSHGALEKVLTPSAR
jgi:hypothetical protein